MDASRSRSARAAGAFPFDAVLAGRIRRLSAAGAVVAVIVGIVVLIGWMLDSAALKSVTPGFVSMKANTALGFIAAGLALMLLGVSRERRGWGVPVSRLLAAFVVLLGAATLTQYLSGVDLRIDRLLFYDVDAIQTSSPGRMAPLSAAAFVVLGAGLLASGRSLTLTRLAQGFASLGVVIALLALTGYIYGAEPLFRFGPWTSMALHTGATFAVLSTALLFRDPGVGLVARFARAGVSGLVARRMLPVALIIPVILGLARVEGQNLGLYGTKLGTALLVSTLIVVTGAFIMFNVGAIERIDARRAQAEDELRELNQQLEVRIAERTADLESANAELERFAQTVSHDLRNPLTTIEGFASLLEQGDGLGGEARMLASKIADGAKRMHVLIDDLLDFARAGQRPLEIQALDPATIVKEALRDLPGAEDHVRVLIGELPSCRADAGLLKVAFSNLLSNALKFTRTHSAPLIEVGSFGRGDEVVYFVRDNGVGFAPEQAAEVFEPFRRLHALHEFEGTGVGLATVDRIVRRHGGQVWAESAVGRGATFYLSLGDVREAPDVEPAARA